MEAKQAIALISRGAFPGNSQKWLDLGCGTGTFTRALAAVLGARSSVVGVDLNPPAEPKIIGDVSIAYHRGDFYKDNLPFTDVDGILLANSLHYIRDPRSCLLKLAKYFGAGEKQLLVIEYDTNKANQWVPFPIDATTLKSLLTEIGASAVRELGRTPSRFRSADIYAMEAIITI